MNLYQVQDSDRPMWVAAHTWAEAIHKWKVQISIENHTDVTGVTEPSGINLVCENNNDDFPEYIP